MMHLPFPPPAFNIKKEGEKRYIFDGIRKAWLLLTEEEWVRQNLVAYLLNVLRYPASFVALEKAIEVNSLTKRFDVLVYNRTHEPWLLVECKAPQVTLTEDVLQQALRYNLSVPAKYIVITNGAATIGWEKKEGRLTLLEDLPAFD